MTKYRSLEHSIQALLLERKHTANPKEEGVFATSPRKAPEFETAADEERAKSDTAVRKGQEPLVARPGDDRGRRQDEPEKRHQRSDHAHQFVRKIDVGEETTMKKLPTHLLEAVKKSLNENESEFTPNEMRKQHEALHRDPNAIGAAVSTIERMPTEQKARAAALDPNDPKTKRRIEGYKTMDTRGQAPDEK